MRSNAGAAFAARELGQSISRGGAVEWTRVSLSHNPIGDEGMVPTLTALSQNQTTACVDLQVEKRIPYVCARNMIDVIETPSLSRTHT